MTMSSGGQVLNESYFAILARLRNTKDQDGHSYSRYNCDSACTRHESRRSSLRDPVKLEIMSLRLELIRDHRSWEEIDKLVAYMSKELNWSNINQLCNTNCQGRSQ